jgi:DNA-directed RNA polymerase subunit RPC12/RpoP
MQITLQCGKCGNEIKIPMQMLADDEAEVVCECGKVLLKDGVVGGHN